VRGGAQKPEDRLVTVHGTIHWKKLHVRAVMHDVEYVALAKRPSRDNGHMTQVSGKCRLPLRVELGNTSLQQNPGVVLDRGCALSAAEPKETVVTA
jgi:hypothetical protein